MIGVLTILRGRMTAMITTWEIHYNYNGKTIKTLETKMLSVKNMDIPMNFLEYYHNPPHDFVINYKCHKEQDLRVILEIIHLLCLNTNYHNPWPYIH